MRVRPTPLFLLTSLAMACTDWPRFAADAEPVALFESLRPIEVVEFKDWPDDPSALGSLVDAELTQVMDSVRFEGALDPFGSTTSAAAPAFQASCAGITTGFVGVYNGDVDFVRMKHPGGGLCLYLRAPFDGVTKEPQWDVVVYEFIDGCATGPFLSHPTEDGSQPAPVLDGRRTDASADTTEIVVYVAGVNGYPSIPVTYTLDVVSTSFPERCPVLTDSDFGDPR